jgi:hypothetical protein
MTEGKQNRSVCGDSEFPPDFSAPCTAFRHDVRAVRYLDNLLGQSGLASIGRRCIVGESCIKKRIGFTDGKPVPPRWTEHIVPYRIMDDGPNAYALTP